jgi:hypothetical protein
MTDHQSRLNEARVLAATLDKLTRTPRRFSPSAPWIIPATMIIVCAFALICLAIKLIVNYLNSKNENTKTFGRPHGSSPDIPTTPEDQTSMATTASMKTRGSLGLSSRRHNRSKPPPVSLYQIRQKQSPGSAAKSSKAQRAAMKAMSRAARAEANKSRDSSRQRDDGSDDNSDNAEANSPNLSHRSDDTDEMQQTMNQSGLAYSAAAARHAEAMDGGENMMQGHSSNQPEVHIVQIRDLDEGNLQHSQTTWANTESDI